MKNLFPRTLVFGAFLMCMGWASKAVAQEELGPLRNDRTEQLETTEAESSKANYNKPSFSNREVVRDSVTIKPSASRKSDTKNENPQDDILSFNFLYYIIQRFKLSDIVD
ncbi:MAG: hypothetical protein HRU69_04600 [Flammeovirgaceae bacterium]|nr:MAG: hypothetical protein HRU69_04600 [Flammeovirgaceae bacterium]